MAKKPATKKASGASAPDALVKCLVNNIWTSQGKLKFGDEATLPADEAKAVNDAMMARLQTQAKVH